MIRMPVRSCGGGKYRIGGGKCIYKSKASALRAYKAYLAKNSEADEEKIMKEGLPEEFEEAHLEVEREDNLIRRMFLRRKRSGKGG
jgi:U3 small nucleolar ribonucleoprotein component